ncbi:hypothetical protein HU200_015932 [Digitaria exilis]|uniref:F-box domain-containing protein n=1 Tax=Digitaria exilis TaxID=1010633 RepID=A0A835KK83_9POAL|nr:hypothetical protein HU200_015932 [Digitaria exilis]
MSSADPSAVSALGGRSGITAVDGVLPLELLTEVLLLLPAKEVCRVRAVCPSWRSLTYDPLFVSAYAARHPGPLLYVCRGSTSIDLLDLSGDVVKRLRPNMTGYVSRVLYACFEFVLIEGDNHGISVIDPVSGSVSTLPVGITEGLASSCLWYPSWFAFGKVASTGEYKLVRIVDQDLMCGGYGNDPLCEVLTFSEGFRHWGKNDDPAAYRDGIEQWRKVESAPAYLDLNCTDGVIVEGTAYFLLAQWQFEEPYIEDYNIEPGCIPSFNLETEQWSVALRGPASRIVEESNGMLNYRDLIDRLMLGELKDFLVTVHCNNQTSTADLWFLMDFGNCVWSRQHIIQIEIIPGELKGIQPVFALDEGGVVLLVRTVSGNVLQIYNPGASNRNLLEMACSFCVGVGIYTGNLLA